MHEILLDINSELNLKLDISDEDSNSNPPFLIRLVSKVILIQPHLFYNILITYKLFYIIKV